MATIFFGLGGIGTSIIKRVETRMSKKEVLKKLIGTSVFFYGLDIDPGYDVGKPINHNIQMHPGLRVVDPGSIIKRLWNEDPNFREWWPKSKDEPWGLDFHGDITGSAAAGQIRASGALTFYIHFEEIKKAVQKVWDDACKLSGIGTDASEGKPVIFIVASLGGGTGAGMLIDFCFLVRNIVKNNALIWGVFVDPTVTSQFGGPYTGPQGFAALIEIERWSIYPEEYRKNFGGKANWIPLQDESFSEFLNGTFLIQYYNPDGRCFTGKKTGYKSDDYKELVAEFLFVLGVHYRDINTSLNNIINRFTQTKEWKTENNRSLRYGSFGISSIVFPYERIAEAIGAKIIKQIFKGSTKPISCNLPPIQEFALQTGMDRIEFLTPTKDKLNKMLEKGKNRIKNCTKKDLIQTIREIGWTELESKWKPFLIRGGEHEREIDKILYGDRLAGNKGLIVEMGEKVYEALREKISTLDFDGIIAWLDEFKGWIDKKIEKTAKSVGKEVATEGVEEISEKSYESYVKTTFEQLEKECKRTFRSNWTQVRDDFITYFEKFLWFEFAKIEVPKKNEFYLGIRSYIASLKESVVFLQEMFDNTITKFMEKVGGIAPRETLFDQDRMKENDYPLTIELRTSYIEELCEIFVREKIEIPETILEGFVNPRQEIREALKVKSISEIFSEICTNVSKEQQGDMQTIKNQMYRNLSETIDNLFNGIVLVPIKDIISKYSVWDAMEWHFEHFYERANTATSPTSKEKIKADLSLDLTADIARNLLTSQDLLKDREKWKFTAMAGLLQNLKGLTNYFCKVNSGIKKDLLNKMPNVAGLTFSETLQFYAPEYKKIAEFKPYISGISKDPIPLLDPHQICFMGMEFLFPLFSLENLQHIRQQYFAHRQEFEKGRDVPAHVDSRFYKEWSDDIMLEAPVTSKIETEAVLLYALGTGLRKIVRENDKFIYGGQTIALSLPKLIKRLNPDEMITQSLKIDIKDEIVRRITGRNPIEQISELQNIFVEAYTFHKSIEPVDVRSKEYELWKKIGGDPKSANDNGMIKAEKTAGGSIIIDQLGSEVPKNKEDLVKILKFLEALPE